MAIILGGEGPKSKDIRAYQDNAQLKHEAFVMRDVSQHITEAIRNKILTIDDSGNFRGELKFDSDEDSVTFFPLCFFLVFI